MTTLTSNIKFTTYAIDTTIQIADDASDDMHHAAEHALSETVQKVAMVPCLMGHLIERNDVVEGQGTRNVASTSRITIGDINVVATLMLTTDYDLDETIVKELRTHLAAMTAAGLTPLKRQIDRDIIGESNALTHAIIANSPFVASLEEMLREHFGDHVDLDDGTFMRA